MSRPADSLKPKRRASKACASCHARKVRCDYLQSGNSCTNCRADGFSCEIIPKRPRRRRTLAPQIKRLHSTFLHHADNNILIGAQDSPLSLSPSSTITTNEGNLTDKSTSTTELSQHEVLQQVPHVTFLLGLTQGTSCKEPAAMAPILSNDGFSYLPSRQGVGAALPDSQCGREELKFLQSAECFSLPDKSVMAEFMLTYFQFFHPFFPILSKPEFIKSFHNMDIPDAKGPSLLLLRAMLFIASGLVSEVLLSAAGYDSREEARQSLYRKARLLYDFDFEGDRIAIIQSLLLMSHYYPSMTEKKHTWHWVHQAISMAQVASLHRNHGESSDRNLHARIWWGCLVRDRMNSLGTSRPMVINSLDCNVPMLTIDDLHEPGDDEDQLAVKAMYIEFLKLCQYMEGVLSLRHDIVFVEGRPPDQVKVCDETLQLWLENLPHVAMRQEPNMADDGGVQISALYRAVLHSAYNATIIALHGPCTLPGTAERRHSQSRKNVTSAARDSTQLFSQLVNYDLVRYCPTICVTFVLPPLIVHLVEIRATSTIELKQANGNRFDLCMIFLRQLREVYWHASFYYEFFQLAASIDMPSSLSSMESQDPLIRMLVERARNRTQRLTEARIDDPTPDYGHRQSGGLRVLHNLSQLPVSRDVDTVQSVSVPRSSVGPSGFNQESPVLETHIESFNMRGAEILDESIQFEQWLEAYSELQ